MWLFCKSGFFSAVRHATVPQTIHLRARFAVGLRGKFTVFSGLRGSFLVLGLNGGFVHGFLILHFFVFHFLFLLK